MQTLVGVAPRGCDWARSEPAGDAAGSGGLMISTDQCQVERAVACRALVGSTYVEVRLAEQRYRYESGCDVGCGDREVPALATGLESNNRQSVAACDSTNLLQLAQGLSLELRLNHRARPRARSLRALRAPLWNAAS